MMGATSRWLILLLTVCIAGLLERADAPGIGRKGRLHEG